MTHSIGQVIKVVNQQVKANTYIYEVGPRECLLVDPGLDRESIEEALQRALLRPVAIFCTHGHFDHVGTAEYFRREFEIDIYMHDADTRVARSSNFTMMALKMPWRIDVPKATRPLTEGMRWKLGETDVQVVHVPGHTPGSVVLIIDGRVFTGDTLYRQGVHLGSMPESDSDRLKGSLRRLSDMLPADSEIFPGHGRPAVFGEIRASNEPLRELLGLTDSEGVA